MSEPATPEGPGAEVVPLRPVTSIAVGGDQDYWSEKQIDALKQKLVGEPTVGDLRAYLHLCQTTGLDPFRNEIYLIGRNDKDSPSGKKWTAQTGIDGFRHIAERTGEYEGRLVSQWCGPDGEWRDVWLDPETPPAAARVVVKRKDITTPFTGIATYAEFVPMRDVWEGPSGNRRKKLVDGKPVQEVMGLWGKMPSHMLAKCAEAQAIRAAFPRQTGGVYVYEEMHQADAREENALAAARREEARRAIADRSWQRAGKAEDDGTVVVDAEVLLPDRADMLEELANQAKIMGRSLAAWANRWVAAHKKNVEDATDRELWDLVQSRREMVAAKAGEDGAEPYLAAVREPEPAPADETPAEPEPGDAEVPAPQVVDGLRHEPVEGEAGGSAGHAHAFVAPESGENACDYLGCQMPQGDPVHGVSGDTDADGQATLV